MQSCAQAAQFQLGGGTLSYNSQNIWTAAGLEYAAFQAQGSPPVNSISTTFENVGGVLHWYNDTFTGGEATFCQVAASGQVWFVFSDDLPIDCVSVTLQVEYGKS